MGVNLKELLVREKTSLESFQTRVVAVDAYNAIYQFLATIRGPAGEHLADSRGRVTSHLSGLFYRNISYLSLGIKPVYIFDGTPPSLKAAEIERRRQVKKDAAVKYERAVAAGDMEGAKKYAQQTTYMQDEMVDDAKHLLDLFGIPHIEAPSEGEATAARMTQTGAAWASASQDYDSVLFGARRLVRNFVNSGRRKIPNRNTYIQVEPEIIELQKSLDSLGLTREQLVDIGILVGTDFNPKGFYKVGPKTALKYIREYGRLEDIPKIKDELEETDYEKIREIFLKPDVVDEPQAEFGQADYDGILQYLSSERSFSAERIQSSLNRLKGALAKKSQSLDKWL